MIAPLASGTALIATADNHALDGLHGVERISGQPAGKQDPGVDLPAGVAESQRDVSIFVHVGRAHPEIVPHSRRQYALLSD